MLFLLHYDDVIMTTMASEITSLTIVYSTVYSGANQRKHQSSASLAFVLGIHRGPVNSPHKWPVTRKMPPFDDVIMICQVIFSFIRCSIHLSAPRPTSPLPFGWHALLGQHINNDIHYKTRDSRCGISTNIVTTGYQQNSHYMMSTNIVTTKYQQR